MAFIGEAGLDGAGVGPFISTDGIDSILSLELAFMNGWGWSEVTRMAGGGDIGGSLAGGGDWTFGGDLTSREVVFCKMTGSGEVGELPTIGAIVVGAGERARDLLAGDLSSGFGDPLIIIGDGFLFNAICN